MPDVDLEYKFGFELLPLYFFDDDTLETVDISKIAQDISDDKIVTGKSLLRKGDEITWPPVLVLGISNDRSTYYIEFIDSNIRKYR